MQTQLIRSLIAAAVVGGWVVLAMAQHQDHHPAGAAPAAERPMDSRQMMQGCQAMMQHMHQAQQRMRAMDQQLDEKLETMEQAEGDAKVDAVADVVRELATQRKEMHAMRQRMMNQMMGHMGEHMGMGMDEEARGMMMHCPMMQMHRQNDVEAAPSEHGARHDHGDAHTDRPREVGVEGARLGAPASIQTEHEHLHEQLARAQAAGGETGRAANAVAEVLAPHFAEEEAYAMPPLGLLPALAQGEVTEEMRPAIAKAEQLRDNYDQMLAEHRTITAAVERLEAAAQREGHAEHADFAHRLLLHAQMEEQVLYPTTLLIGQYLRLRLDD
jgi:hypothetical protein